MNQAPFPALDYPSFPTRPPGQGRVLIAFSGGPDSLCLAALACEHWREWPLLAIHVDHGQDEGSRQRASKAAGLAEQLGLAHKLVRVQLTSEGGPEAAARRARYEAFERELDHDDTLLMAHHADDQAETVLLRLLRGSGPAGLGGMPVSRRLGHGQLYRPLLGWRREDIIEELNRRGLTGLNDPHNQRSDLDRNYLRHQILPRLEQRWPGACQSVLRSARLCRESAAELSRLSSHGSPRSGDLPDQRAIPPGLAENHFGLAEFIRQWTREVVQSTPPGPPLDEFVRQVQQHRPDRHPALQWNGLVLRNYRAGLWLERTTEPTAKDWSLDWQPAFPLSLPGTLGRLVITGVDADKLPKMQVRDGRPGDRMRLHPGGTAQPLNALLHEAGIPPWWRNSCPRLVGQGRILALGDRWLDPGFATDLRTSNSRLEWHGDLKHLLFPRTSSND